MTKIHLESFGAGKPIVLVHGWAMHSGIWRDFARQLARNYKVICVDLPGHGHSEKIDPFTLEHISDQLVEIIPPNPPFSKGGANDQLVEIIPPTPPFSKGEVKQAQFHETGCNGQSQFYAVDDQCSDQQSSPTFEKGGQRGICWLGWSLGATIALDIAGRYPERVSALILLAGNPLFTHSSTKRQPSIALDSGISEGMTATSTEQWPGMDVRLLDDFAEHLYENGQATLLRFLSLQVKNLPNHKVLLKQLRTAVLECAAPDQTTLQGGLNILKNTDQRPVLSGLTMPVSVILGSLDTLVPVASGQKMQQLLPTLDLNIIDRAGHVPFLSHSGETLAIISRFMNEQCS